MNAFLYCARLFPAAYAAMLLALALPAQAAQADIASLPPVLQGVISGALAKRDPLYRVAAEGDGYRVRNARQEFDASVGAPGMAIAAGGAQWRMSLAGWERGASTQRAAALATKASGNRVEVERGGVTEWWVNGPVGLQQGWTVASRPFPGDAGELSLVMQQSGSLRARAGAERALEVADAGGRVVLRYGGLTAFDATGRELPVRFEVSSDEVRVRVQDAGAVYPVLVDPIAQSAYLKPNNSGGGEFFGYTVATSGDTVVVGAYLLDSVALDSGAAFVFVRSGASWTQQAYLIGSNTEASDQFGTSVAISGDTLIVGAAGEASNATGVNGDETDNNAPGSGAAYVFVRSGGVWTQQAYLKASGTAHGFGFSAAISGDTAVLGTNVASSPVYVFTRSGIAWSQQAILTASNAAPFDGFGNSVAVSGDTVVVGAYGEASNATGVNGDQTDNSASQAGAAYVFVRSGVAWSQQAYLKASNTEVGDQFGWSVAISGDTIVVGAYFEGSSATGVNGSQANGAPTSGAAYVFVRSGVAWSQQAYLKASNTSPGDQFGYSVAISGDTVVVGAPFEDSNATGVDGDQVNNSANASGAAYVFVRSGSTWSQQSYLKASNTGVSDQFGFSVAISGDTVVVSAAQEASNATGVDGNQADNSLLLVGAAYVFDRTCCAVTPSATANGSIAPNTAQTVTPGNTTAFTITPNPGFSIQAVTGTCNGSLVGNTFTTNAVVADCTVIANFVISTYAVTSSGGGANGTVTPPSQPVNHGSTAAFTVTPAAGYTASFGGTCPAGSFAAPTYTTGAITGACDVAVTFTLNSYSVNSSGGGVNGTITPPSQPVNHGSTAAFIVTPVAGYSASFGGTCPAGSFTAPTYTTGAITGACNVAVTFTLNSYTVSSSGGGANGTITPASQPANHGSTATFTVTPVAGYTASVGGTCPPGSLVGTTYTTGAITAACNVAATFSLNSYTVTASAGANGTITPPTQTVAHGGTTNFTVTPNPGYTAAIGGTCPAGSLVGTTYTTGTIIAACSVSATFTLNTYAVTASAGANGTVTPPSQTVAHGNTTAFTVTSNPGYAAVVGGTCPAGSLVGTTYTTGPITGACTVSATFTSAAVTSFTAPTATGTGNATASFTGGGPTCTFTLRQFIPLTGHANSPPAGLAPAQFPQGLFNFTMNLCTPGSAVVMTIAYPSAIPAGAQYWKYGPEPGNATPHWYLMPATITGNTVVFTITDGAQGDDDLAANGTIVDQGGPGVPPIGGGGGGAAGIPTLSEWAMIVLASLLLAMGLRRESFRSRE